MSDRVILLVDGENLLFRFQDSIKQGMKQKSDVKHKENSFLWHPDITSTYLMNIIRVSYYTTCIGDDDKLSQLKNDISTIRYDYRHSNIGGFGTLNPHVFKKSEVKAKTKSVDINITIDALRHTYNNSVDIIYFLTGDGDYLPLIEEVMRQGKQAYIGAFSNGLNPLLKNSCDDFFDLDKIFFEPHKDVE